MITLYNKDFREVDIPENSVDLIFTDPPYDKESIILFESLAELGQKVLKPGGSLLTYVGHYAIPQVLDLMEDKLRFWWLIVLDEVGKNRRFPGKFVFVHYKPVLWFVKEKRANKLMVADLCRVKSAADKELHPWEQSIEAPIYYIDKLTEEGGTVLDPMMGTGTTGVAAASRNRNFIGIEMNEDTYNKAVENKLKPASEKWGLELNEEN